MFWRRLLSSSGSAARLAHFGTSKSTETKQKGLWKWGMGLMIGSWSLWCFQSDSPVQRIRMTFEIPLRFTRCASTAAAIVYGNDSISIISKKDVSRLSIFSLGRGRRRFAKPDPFGLPPTRSQSSFSPRFCKWWNLHQIGTTRWTVGKRFFLR